MLLLKLSLQITLSTGGQGDVHVTLGGDKLIDLWDGLRSEGRVYGGDPSMGNRRMNEARLLQAQEVFI